MAVRLGRAGTKGQVSVGVIAEEHLDCLETQVGLIDALGVPNYLQSAVGSLDEAKTNEAAAGD